MLLCWSNKLNRLQTSRFFSLPKSRSSGRSYDRRSALHRAHVHTSFHGTEPRPPCFLSFALHQSELWGAPRPDALALPGLLDKTVLSVFILFFFFEQTLSWHDRCEDKRHKPSTTTFHVLINLKYPDTFTYSTSKLDIKTVYDCCRTDDLNISVFNISVWSSSIVRTS